MTPSLVNSMSTLVKARFETDGSDLPVQGSRPLLLLASDGSGAAAAAMWMTVALAAEGRADARVISVLLPQSYAQPEFVVGIGDAQASAVMHSETDRRLQSISRHMRDASASQLGWPVDIEVGPPASIIVREARRQGASLVVMGLRAHGTVERWLRDETTLRVVRESPVPVLAVTPLLNTLPQRVAVAVDFSRASLRAARVAISMLAPNGTLHVVYVRPATDNSEETEGTNAIYSQGIASSFARLRKELSVPAGIHVEAVLLDGEPAPELIAFAYRADINLIAVGSHRHPFLTRLLVGSVTSALVRSAKHSLLIAPPAPAGSV